MMSEKLSRYLLAVFRFFLMVTLALLVCVASALARPQYLYEPPPAASNILLKQVAPPSDVEPGMPYDLDWNVSDKESGNDFSHSESSSDGILTKGSYRVLLPDGRTQVVAFTVNGNDGYVADVQYVK